MMQDLLLYSQATIKSGSKSFAKAAMLFDRETRHSVRLLYAWCRYCDDVIDGQTLGHGLQTLSHAEQTKRLQALQAQTAEVFAGQPSDHPAFAALAYVVSKHGMHERHALELLQGFALDVTGSRFETLDDTLHYCYHVAGVVGVMMAQIMGVRDPATLLRAADLGIAFQLTNIARDVIDDHAIGRCYLPQQWLRAARIPESEIGQPQHRAALHMLTQDLLQVAEDYYASARFGIGQLPLRSAWAIASALLIYRDIGLQIKTAGTKAWQQRAQTSAAKKMLLIGGGYGMAIWHVLLAGKYKSMPRGGLWTKTYS